ncbi:6768_t:CDS:2, partial [Diversispora eburnea]
MVVTVGARLSLKQLHWYSTTNQQTNLAPFISKKFSRIEKWAESIGEL